MIHVKYKNSNWNTIDVQNIVRETKLSYKKKALGKPRLPCSRCWPLAVPTSPTNSVTLPRQWCSPARRGRDVRAGRWGLGTRERVQRKMKNRVERRYMGSEGQILKGRGKVRRGKYVQDQAWWIGEGRHSDDKDNSNRRRTKK